MHSMTATHGTIFHYDSDLDGDVIIVVPQNSEDMDSLTVPAGDILEFVAFCYVQPKRINALEQADYHQLLTGDSS
tara:strand:- start:967 stop:1191 length:225 start_codon:yes stop_codon:yes gene_type:complete